MGYQPGPLLLQAAGNVGIATSDYNFAGDVADQLNELETIPGGWDSFLQDATLLMSEPSNPFPDVDIDGGILAMHAYSDPEALLGTDALVTALGDADLQLGTAIGFAPAESWADSSTPFVAPVPAETIGVPIIPPGAINFQVTGTVGGAAAPSTFDNIPGAASVTLLNTSQYGSSNFRVGDQFQVTAKGAYGQIVYAYATVNGADIGGGPQGSIGFDGQLVKTGTMGEDQVGVWSEQWYVGSVLESTFNFIVVDA